MNPGTLRLAPLASLVLGLVGCAVPGDDPGDPRPLEEALDPETSGLEGTARGFPAMRDLEGRPLAAGEFSQWLDGDQLHVKIRYVFDTTRWIEENSVIRQEPSLVQERWSWVEMREGQIQRRFEIDFLAANATAEKLEKGEMRRWSEHVDVEPGRAFAGSAWALAIRGLRPRLLRGEAIELNTVGFTPKPRSGTVRITHEGLDRLPMSGQMLTGDRFRIHPEIPWVVRVFVDVPDSKLWLTNPAPAAFLRFEGPLAEPDDPIIRVDLLPGEPSGAASPASR
jgi:hypothetical protein